MPHGSTSQLCELHCYLGHIHHEAIRDATRDGLIEGLKIDPNNADEQFCEEYAAGKLTLKPFLKESLNANNFSERVHCNLQA